MKALLFVTFILIQTISLSFQAPSPPPVICDGKYFIVNKANCDVLEIEKGSKECGANVIVSCKNGGDSEKFIIKNVDCNYVTIVNEKSCLALTIETKKDGAFLEQTPIIKGCPNAFQLFKIIKDCDDHYLILNKASGLFINGNSCASTPCCNRAAIQTEKCPSDIENFLFKFLPVC